MNFEVFVLGTSGMMPLPNRFLTSAMVRRDGELFLFDCGEGTQVSLKMLNLKWKKIHSIFISHMHADHVTGLPGILMLSSQVDRDEPLTLYGPPKLKEYVDANRRILDMYINYEIIVKTVEPGIILETDDFIVRAFRLNHTKPCLGYVMQEKDRPGEFHPEKAQELGIPVGPLWGKLQRGETVTLSDGRVITSTDVMGEKRGGRKFSYVTDSLYLPSIAKEVEHSDLLLCEGMFTSDMEETAYEKKHMTAGQAAQIAKDAEVAKLGLLHYSPRYGDRELRFLLKDARKIFPDTILTKDRMSFEIPLKD
ncbi:MAG: ribonuclease Z [Sphaerochaeta sp.]|jgi:ribonuclease Z|uniref:ribonuclease Z n=1 Tax=Sphaerochaeta sp. S2 TaxID=2798868 RepID=UPI0018E96455|nr:ribonuclease Z [Sphaerochaeta sp. S2]MCK9348398.1 ribonuclease Z [Sphaerochaeta sp.]MBJ2356626.1 ribonuclease Z [Sphaerochaeta sp. S2]MDD4300990.1 ribonuclease Z [Sphaerochaeta sp.]MDD4647519.1 ribonuclease Z [Sphaerochaeta sp.]MDY0244362.1 ribonuclease Z [Sphaerochaeta sp.]